MKKYFIKWIGIMIACVCVIAAFLVIRNMSAGGVQGAAAAESELLQTSGDTPYFRISLPNNYAGTVHVEENLIEKAIHVEFTGISEFLFSAIAIEENDSRVLDTRKSFEGTVGTIILQLDDGYVCKSTQEGTQLSLDFEPIREKYDRIIVIDPGHGGESDTGTIAYGYEEKNLTLAIAKSLKETLETEFPESYICLTRIDDVSLTEQERESFAKQLGADLYLSVHMNADPKSRATEGVSTYYNKQDSKGKQFAEILQKNMEKSTESTLQFDVQADTEIFTKEFALPSLVIEAGYLTNKQEAMKLGTAEYRKLLADGVTAGIREIWNE